MPVGDASPPSDDPLIGVVLSDRYRILRKIGEGGMGCVYQAEHALIEKKIALKILFQELTRRPDLVARFLQEAKSASRIGHENVIDISDFGQSPDGLVYIAMEYLDGQDLGKLLKAEKVIEWQRARPILMQITKGLRAAHQRGVIHRDMKPENIFLIQRDGRPDFVKVLDFGIAKVVNPDESDGPRLTQTGMIFGTPEYMSPEQAQGQAPDHRVDVYAVGCIMYHLLTGQVPFMADNFMGILTKHLMEAPVPPRQRRPDLQIPADVEAVCLQALEKDRDKRFPDMDAFYRALGAAGGLPFEPSSVFAAPAGVPRANLKYPALAAPSAEARASRTAIASPISPTGSFEDERPGRPGDAPAGGGKLKIAAIVGVLAAGGVAAALALRGGDKAAPAVTAAPAAAAPAAPTPAAPSEVVVNPTPPPAPPSPPAEAKAPVAEPAAEPAGKPGRKHRRVADEAAPIPARRQVDVPTEPTPVELKNPFNQ
jgi:serine/threonine protein kinase